MIEQDWPQGNLDFTFTELDSQYDPEDAYPEEANTHDVLPTYLEKAAQQESQTGDAKNQVPTCSEKVEDQQKLPKMIEVATPC